MPKESGNRRYCRPELPQFTKRSKELARTGLKLPEKPFNQLVKILGMALLGLPKAAVSTPSPFKVDLGCQYDSSPPANKYGSGTSARIGLGLYSKNNNPETH